MRVACLLLTLSASAVLVCPAAAESSRVVLRTGKVLYGEVIERTDEHVTLRSGGLKMTLPRADIESIGPLFTPTPAEAEATPTPTPDQAAILRRAAWAWAARILTMDFGGAWDMSGTAFQGAVPREVYAAWCREHLGDSGLSAPDGLEVDVDGERAVVRVGVPPKLAAAHDASGWPWTSGWVMEEGQWRQAPLESGEPQAAMLEYQRHIPPAPSPSPTPERGGLPERSTVSELLPMMTEPTAIPAELPEEAAPEPESATGLIGTTTAQAMLAGPSPVEIWEDLRPETQATVLVMLGLHAVFCLWVYADSRRRVGRGFWMMAAMFLGGVLTGCVPLPWVAYLIIRAKT